VVLTFYVALNVRVLVGENQTFATNQKYVQIQNLTSMQFHTIDVELVLYSLIFGLRSCLSKKYVRKVKGLFHFVDVLSYCSENIHRDALLSSVCVGFIH
jgi:hypothetical protein